MVAVTGQRAQSAIAQGVNLETSVELVATQLEDKSLPFSRASSLLQDLCDEVNAATIQAWRKEQIRTKLQALSKLRNDAERKRKNEIAKKAVGYAKQVHELNPDAPFIVLQVTNFVFFGRAQTRTFHFETLVQFSYR